MIMQPCIPNACDNSPTYFGVGATAAPTFDDLAYEPNLDAIKGLDCPYTPSDDYRNPLDLRITGFGGWRYRITISLRVDYVYAQPRKNEAGDCIGVDWFTQEAGTVEASGTLQTNNGDFTCDDEGEFSKQVGFQISNGYLTISGGEFDTSYIKQQFPETATKGLRVMVAEVKIQAEC